MTEPAGESRHQRYRRELGEEYLERQRQRRKTAKAQEAEKLRRRTPEYREKNRKRRVKRSEIVEALGKELPNSQIMEMFDLSYDRLMALKERYS